MKPDELMNVIKNRRSTRAFKDKPVEKEKIKKIIEAGSWAPTAGHCESWFFIVVQDNKTRAELCNNALRQTWIHQAPVLIVVCSDLRRIARYGERGIKLYSVQETAAGIQNMMLMAQTLGLGTCWIGAFDERQVSNILDLPDYIRPLAVIPLGYPDESPKSTRRSVKEVSKWI